MRYRYELIAFDGFARWQTRKTGLRTREDARRTKYFWSIKIFKTPTIIDLKWPTIKIWDRKLKKFIY